MSNMPSIITERFMQMLREEFSGEEQEMFVQDFLVFVDHDSLKDFVIDFDNLYLWAGFACKYYAKTNMQNNLVKNIDYTISPIPHTNKNKIMMTVHGFHIWCSSSHTAKGKRCYKYFSRMLSVTTKYLRQILEEQLVRGDALASMSIN